MSNDPYNWKHRLEMEKQRLTGTFVKREGIKISQNDINLILEFIDECRAEGLSAPRIVNYMRVLRLSKKFLPVDFDKATKQDMKKAIGDLENSDFTDWTKQGYRIAFKKFYRWLYTEKLGQKLKRKEYPEIVEWINTTMKKNKQRLPEGILKEEDVKKLLENCNNLRDKAIVSVLWDSGCRISELLGLKLKDVEFDKYGAFIIVNGKTGARRVRLIPSVPYLANWKEHHPNRDNPDSPLFVGIGTKNIGGKLCYNTADTMLRKLGVRAGLNKRTNAHSFRHARATYFAPKVTGSVMNESFGWSKGSQMSATYVHLSGADVDKHIRKAQGILDEEEKKEASKLKPVCCLRCGNDNPATSKYCLKCSFILDETKARAEIQGYEGMQKQIDDIKKMLGGKVGKTKAVREIAKKKL